MSSVDWCRSARWRMTRIADTRPAVTVPERLYCAAHIPRGYHTVPTSEHWSRNSCAHRLRYRPNDFRLTGISIRRRAAATGERRSVRAERLRFRLAAWARPVTCSPEPPPIDPGKFVNAVVRLRWPRQMLLVPRACVIQPVFYVRFAIPSIGQLSSSSAGAWDGRWGGRKRQPRPTEDQPRWRAMPMS